MAANALRLRIEGMDCGACAVKIENAMQRLPGVSDITVSYSQASLSLTLDEDRTSRATIEAGIKALGFTPFGPTGTAAAANDLGQPAAERTWWSTRKGRSVVGTGALLAIAYAVSHIEPAWSGWTYVAATLVGLLPIGRRALVGARSGTPFSIETLMSVAAVGAMAIGAAGEAAILDKVVSTDPPYYDNVPYADLSDFFYIWLRRSLRAVFGDLFATVAVPKTEELVAFAYRHRDRKEGAEAFFLSGMSKAMHRLAEQSHPAFPVSIYYAFKQTESDNESGTASTGWETFLDAVIRAGFAISGTWPMRTELQNRMRGMASNALASSIVLICRRRDAAAPSATRREFVAALKAELPGSLRHLQAGNIAPVDLAQAAIGPGMGVYTRYAKVLDAEGKSVSVREALALINATLDEALAEQEGDFDADSRWALAWFEQVGFNDGEYGVAETLSKAKNTSVAGLATSGILDSRRGKVRLLKPEELPASWDPATDPRLTSWEVAHHLIRVLGSGGESAAADLVTKLGARAEPARELAYRLYTICERKKRAAEALAYNGLVQSWPEIVRLAQEGGKPAGAEPDLFATGER